MADRIKIQNAYHDPDADTLWADTPAGDVYIWVGEPGIRPRPDAALADAVCDKGSINPDKWVFHRAIYGSPAFEAEEAEAHMYATAIRSGACSEDDPLIPTNIRTLL